jgi:hypothetical protein
VVVWAVSSPERLVIDPHVTPVTATSLNPAGAMLSQRHAAERLQTCWHGGGLSLEDVRKQMRDALDEFLVAGSGSEVAAVSGRSWHGRGVFMAWKGGVHGMTGGCSWGRPEQMRDALDEFLVAGSGSEVAAVRECSWRGGGGVHGMTGGCSWPEPMVSRAGQGWFARCG